MARSERHVGQTGERCAVVDWGGRLQSLDLRRAAHGIDLGLDTLRLQAQLPQLLRLVRRLLPPLLRLVLRLRPQRPQRGEELCTRWGRTHTLLAGCGLLARALCFARLPGKRLLARS